MAFCTVGGSLEAMSMKRDGGNTLYWGDMKYVRFFSDDHMPELPGQVTIHSETYKPRSLEADASENTKRSAELKCGAWMGTFEHYHERNYHVTLMLPADDFDIFSRTVDTHFGGDIDYSFSFQYLEFSSKFPGEPTKDEFLKGKNLVIKNIGGLISRLSCGRLLPVRLRFPFIGSGSYGMLYELRLFLQLYAIAREQ